MFIAIGAAASSAAFIVTGNKIISSILFSVGLIFITFFSGELFTGDILLVNTLGRRGVRAKFLIPFLAAVWVENYIGTFCMAGLLFGADYYKGEIGAYAINTAITKTELSACNMIFSGILCNILVCAAVLMAASAKSCIGKIMGVAIPITIFVLCGFEHCVANMYYFSAGYFASQDPNCVQMAIEKFNITPERMKNFSFVKILSNLVLVTIGNILGGIFLAKTLYISNREQIEKELGD